MERWTSFPTWWVRQGLLNALHAAQASTGQNIAALKVYLALSINADFESRNAEISLTQLQVLTGLTRPMVTAGLKTLEAMNVIKVDRSAYRNIYHQVQAEAEVHWMKIPTAAVRAKLRELPNSTQSALAALKLYMVFLTVRQRGSHESPISHRKLQARTGVRPGLISRGVSHLISHGLLRFANKPIYTDAAGHPVNTYYLLGSFAEADTLEDSNLGTSKEFVLPEPVSAFLSGPLLGASTSSFKKDLF